MIVRINIDSDCTGILHFKTRDMGKEVSVYLPKYRSRLSEYDGEQLIKELQQNPDISTIYLYRIFYPDGRVSVIANPHQPIGNLICDDSE